MSTKKGLDSQTILNAAAELAEEKGLENISLLQVAEKLGVKPPSLYNHLRSLLSVGLKIPFAAQQSVGQKKMLWWRLLLHTVNLRKKILNFTKQF